MGLGASAAALVLLLKAPEVGPLWNRTARGAQLLAKEGLTYESLEEFARQMAVDFPDGIRLPIDRTFFAPKAEGKWIGLEG